MIDVPVRVKDALKSGNLKKEYLITISDYTHLVFQRTQRLEQYGDWWFPTIGTTGTYRFRSNIANAFTEVKVEKFTGDDGDEEHTETQYFHDVKADENGTYIDIPLTAGSYRHIGFWDGSVVIDEIDIYLFVTDDYTIGNENLVSESVKFDERMCSGTELKFGLCEGSSIEFQYFNLGSILNKQIYVEVNVQYKNASNELAWYSIPLGYFTVDSCSRQASTGIIKATAYNKLKSSYLDKPVNAQILSLYSGSSLTLHSILDSLLSGFGIEDYGDEEVPTTYIADNNFAHAFYLSYAVSGGSTYRRVTNGTRFAVYYGHYRFKTDTQWTSDKYYRLIIRTATALHNMNSFFLNGIGGYYSQNIWIGADTGQETGNAISLYDYMRGNYNYSRFMRGFFRFSTTVNGVTTYHDYPIYPDGSVYNIDYLKNIDVGSSSGIEIELYIPALYNTSYSVENDSIFVEASKDFSSDLTDSDATTIRQRTIFGVSSDSLSIYCGTNVNDVNMISISKSEIANITNNITLRELQSASFELECQYGKLDRITDLFSGITLGNGSLYPADDLYPADTLYPAGSVESGHPAMYSKLWANENNVRSFRYLIITYKSTETIDGETKEVEKTLQRTVNTSGTDDYNMSDNWVFRNLVWTAAQVGALADQMVTKMQNIQWFPFEMWCAGLPYLEAGDQIEIWAADGIHPSYILQRTLDGIQNLQDTMINGDLDIF